MFNHLLLFCYIISCNPFLYFILSLIFFDCSSSHLSCPILYLCKYKAVLKPFSYGLLAKHFCQRQTDRTTGISPVTSSPAQIINSKIIYLLCMLSTDTYKCHILSLVVLICECSVLPCIPYLKLVD